jgi:hypothetical protein
MIHAVLTVNVYMRTRKLAVQAIVFYACVIGLIVLSFGWQMMHGVCPVP